MRLRLSKGKIDMCDERFVVCEMMVGWKKGDQSLRVHLPEARHGIGNGWSGPMIVWLDEQARRRDLRYLIGVITLMSPRQYQECLGPWYYPGYPAAGLLQERFAAGQSAELLGPVIACDSPGQGKESLAIPTG